MRFYQLENKVSCLRDIAWKTKAAVDRHTAGSMLFQRNKDFVLTSNSLKILYLAVISLKNFKRKLSYTLHENRKFISFSISSEWQKEQVLKFIGVLGIVCLSVSIHIGDSLVEICLWQFCAEDCLLCPVNQIFWYLF